MRQRLLSQIFNPIISICLAGLAGCATLTEKSSMNEDFKVYVEKTKPQFPSGSNLFIEYQYDLIVNFKGKIQVLDSFPEGRPIARVRKKDYNGDGKTDILCRIFYPNNIDYDDLVYFNRNVNDDVRFSFPSAVKTGRYKFFSID